MRVLIVDDDDIIVEVIRDSVHWDRLGVQQVFTAYNAAAARNILLNEHIDLIISDIEMPQESGLELLEWYQEQHQNGKFILLTAHESFSYARQALQLQAADYLLKPFHVDGMELVLQKNIAQLEKERSASQQQQMGEWMLNHMDELQQTFYEGLIRGKIHNNPEDIQENIRIRNLNISPDAQYRLAVVRVTGFDQDQEQYGSESVVYMFGRLLSEAVFGGDGAGRVVSFERHNRYILYFAICDPKPDAEMMRLFSIFQHRSCEMLEATITTCIGHQITMDCFHEQASRLVERVSSEISYYGQISLDTGNRPQTTEMTPVLNMEHMKELFEGRKQKQLLDEMKREIENRLRTRSLDSLTLRVIRMEYQQAVYSYLANNGIMISSLMNDTEIISAVERAEQSPMDLLRWANMMTAKAFENVELIQKSQTLIPQIDAYIHAHYAERIGRNEIGQEFHMVPEYLAKIYKRKTGKTLKDAINEYRISRAKLLLVQSEMRVIDIALETGFDNVSYFSTLFKKITGMSPVDYRKQG